MNVRGRLTPQIPEIDLPDTGLRRALADFPYHPAPDWTDWSSEEETVHGISRELLENKGVKVSIVADEMLKNLSGHDLYASAPSWDGNWLGPLLQAPGHPQHALRLQKSNEAFQVLAQAVLVGSISEAELPIIS